MEEYERDIQNEINPWLQKYAGIMGVNNYSISAITEESVSQKTEPVGRCRIPTFLMVFDARRFEIISINGKPLKWLFITLLLWIKEDIRAMINVEIKGKLEDLYNVLVLFVR